MAKEHSGGCPEIAWERPLNVENWRDGSFPVQITHFPYEAILRRLDGSDTVESEAAVAAKAGLKVLREILRWIRGEGRLGGQRTRLYVALRVFLADDYEGKTDLEMARLAGLQTKQGFSKEKLRFARGFGYRERNMRSAEACAAMRASYWRRHS